MTSLRRPSAQAASRRAHGQTSWSTFSRQARLSQAKAGASRATGARTDPRKDRRAEGQARQSPRRRRRRLSLRRPPATPAVLGSCGHEWCWSSLGGRLAPRRRRTRLRSCARDARSVRLKRATSARSARRSVFVSMKRAVDQVRFGCGGFTGRGRVGGSEQTPCCSATITMTTTSTAPAAPCCHRRVPQSPPSRVPSAWGVTPAASAMGEDVAGVSSTASGPDHRHTLPPSAPVDPPDRGRGDWVRASVGRPGAGVLWISGDTVLYDLVRQVAHRLQVGTALLHLGGALPDLRSGALHHDCQGSRRAVPPCSPPHRHPDPREG